MIYLLIENNLLTKSILNIMIKYTKSEMRDLIIAFIVITIAFAISNVGLNVHDLFPFCQS